MSVEVAEFYRSKQFPGVLLRVLELSDDRIIVELHAPYKGRTWYYMDDFCSFFRKLSSLEKELL